MREESLLCQLRKRFVVTTDSQHGFFSYPNLLKARTLTRPNEAWCADITYIRLPTCFCYLAALIDVFSRYCVGWHLSKDIDTRLTLAALEMALQRRCPPPGLIHHSDRGVQYASSAYIARLEEVGALPSMAARGNPYDNAFAESFFKTLKREEVYINEYPTFQEAHDNLGVSWKRSTNGRARFLSLISGRGVGKTEENSGQTENVQAIRLLALYEWVMPCFLPLGLTSTTALVAAKVLLAREKAVEAVKASPWAYLCQEESISWLRSIPL
jgi:transposase InsO family protein